jgi:hypothetical protein
MGWNWLRVVDMQQFHRLSYPMVFACDFAPFTVVLMEGMSFRQVGGEPHIYDYQITLIEYLEWAKYLGAFLGLAGGLIGSKTIGILKSEEYGNLGI